MEDKPTLDAPDKAAQEFLQILAWGFGLEGFALLINEDWLLCGASMACCVLFSWLYFNKSSLGMKVRQSLIAINRCWGAVAIVVFIMVLISTILPLAKFFNTDPLDKTVLLECVPNALPKTMPVTGVINQLCFSPTASDSTLGITTITAAPGATLDWTHVASSYRCRVTAKKEMTSELQIEFPGYFTEGKKDEGSHAGYGAEKDINYTIHNHAYIPVSPLHTTDVFEFFIFNTSVDGLSIPMPKTVSLKQENSATPRIIKLIPATTTGLPLFLPPVKPAPNEPKINTVHPTCPSPLN